MILIYTFAEMFNNTVYHATMSYYENFVWVDYMSPSIRHAGTLWDIL